MSFVHLHVHTAYSTSDSTVLIPALVSKAKKLGMPALAITDHGNLYGTKEFCWECERQEIKPIIGCEMYVLPDTGRLCHLTLLAENNVGFCNLVKLVYESQKNIVNNKPAAKMQDFENCTGGLIALSGCIGGEVPRKLIEASFEDALAAALEYQQLFAPGCFFIEITTHGWMHNKRINPSLIEISRCTGLPMVATNDVHMLNKTDGELFAAMRGENLQKEFKNLFLVSETEIREQMEDFPFAEQAISMTAEISERCNVDPASVIHNLAPAISASVFFAPSPVVQYIHGISRFLTDGGFREKWVWGWKELSENQKNTLYQIILKQHTLFTEQSGCLPDKKAKKIVLACATDEIAGLENFPLMPKSEIKRIFERYISRINKRINAKSLFGANAITAPPKRKRNRRKKRKKVVPEEWRQLPETAKARLSSRIRNYYDTIAKDTTVTADEIICGITHAIGNKQYKIPLDITPQHLEIVTTLLVKRWVKRDSL